MPVLPRPNLSVPYSQVITELTNSFPTLHTHFVSPPFNSYSRGFKLLIGGTVIGGLYLLSLVIHFLGNLICKVGNGLSDLPDVLVKYFKNLNDLVEAKKAKGEASTGSGGGHKTGGAAGGGNHGSNSGAGGGGDSGGGGGSDGNGDPNNNLSSPPDPILVLLSSIQRLLNELRGLLNRRQAGLIMGNGEPSEELATRISQLITEFIMNHPTDNGILNGMYQSLITQFVDVQSNVFDDYNVLTGMRDALDTMAGLTSESLTRTYPKYESDSDGY